MQNLGLWCDVMFCAGRHSLLHYLTRSASIWDSRFGGGAFDWVGGDGAGSRGCSRKLKGISIHCSTTKKMCQKMCVGCLSVCFVWWVVLFDLLLCFTHKCEIFSKYMEVTYRSFNFCGNACISRHKWSNLIRTFLTGWHNTKRFKSDVTRSHR